LEAPTPDPYYLETSVPACSRRATPQPIKRRTSAAGEGAMAIPFVHPYLASGWARKDREFADQ
jgi:hypothetical protein